jgi:hypothetical protein
MQNKYSKISNSSQYDDGMSELSTNQTSSPPPVLCRASSPLNDGTSIATVAGVHVKENDHKNIIRDCFITNRYYQTCKDNKTNSIQVTAGYDEAVCVESESDSDKVSDNDSIDNDVDDEDDRCSTVIPTSSTKLTTVNGLGCVGGGNGNSNGNGSCSKSSDYNDTVDDYDDTLLDSNTNTDNSLENDSVYRVELPSFSSSSSLSAAAATRTHASSAMPSNKEHTVIQLYIGDDTDMYIDDVVGNESLSSLASPNPTTTNKHLTKRSRGAPIISKIIVSTAATFRNECKRSNEISAKNAKAEISDSEQQQQPTYFKQSSD